MNNPKLLNFLFDKGVIDRDQKRIVEIESHKHGFSVEKCITGMSLTTPHTLTKLINEFNNNELDINNFIVDTNLLDVDPYSFCEAHQCLPIYLNENCLYIAMSKHDMNTIEAITKFLKFTRAHVITLSSSEVYELIQKHYAVLGNWIDFISHDSAVEVVVDRLLLDAVSKRASDIHFSCDECVVKVRYRVDGDLKRICIFHKDYFAKILVRMKLMFSVDITPVVRSRDGNLTKCICGERFDFRISFHGCVHGENVVIRVLSSKNQVHLDELGYSPKVLMDIRSMIRSHGGLVIFIGPTGSGKTTSLYAALSEIDHEKLNIMTAEDPIEKKIRGAQQVDVNSHPDLNFANCLRSILRQDPDVILIGEIRDSETAQMSLRAAMTGHKVFTTLHAKNVIDVIDRLEELGMPRRLAINNIRGIVAQRLVKKNCEICKGEGCAHCGGAGSHSRCVIAESLLFTNDVIEILGASTTSAEKGLQLSNIGYQTMLDDGMEKVRLGIIAHEELVQNVEQASSASV